MSALRLGGDCWRSVDSGKSSSWKWGWGGCWEHNACYGAQESLFRHTHYTSVAAASQQGAVQIVRFALDIIVIIIIIIII